MGVLPGSQSVRSPGSLAERHASYASIVQQARAHAQEIISIGLAISDDGAKVHAVQPLYAAGQVLGIEAGNDEADKRELTGLRKCLLKLLKDIEKGTGWATEYRVAQLLELWGLPADWGTGWFDGDGAL